MFFNILKDYENKKKNIDKENGEKNIFIIKSLNPLFRIIIKRDEKDC